jgi:cell wall-associated NlpC family hydrolase
VTSRGLRAVRVLLVTALAFAGAVVPGSAAHASPGLDEARRKARELRKNVERLELATAMAIEDYNEAYDELSRAIAARLEAQAAVDRARDTADAGADVLASRVRSMYMTGGSMSLYASVLGATDLHDAFGRLANVNSIVRQDSAVKATADEAHAKAQAAAVQLRDVALKQTRLERQVAAASQRVERSLAEQRTLLAKADATVRQMAEEERRAAEAAAERAARAAFEAARVAAEAARAAAERAAGQAVTRTSDGRVTVGGPVLGTLAGSDTTPPNAIVARAIAAARTQLGKPYQWGAVGPDTFDCSGLTGWAYRQAGLSLPRTSRQQWFAGTHPAFAEMRPGDLLFWGSDRSNPQSIHHVAMYIGDGQMISAPRTGTVVRIQPVYVGDFFGVTRPT